MTVVRVRKLCRRSAHLLLLVSNCSRNAEKGEAEEQASQVITRDLALLISRGVDAEVSLPSTGGRSQAGDSLESWKPHAVCVVKSRGLRCWDRLE